MDDDRSDPASSPPPSDLLAGVERTSLAAAGTTHGVLRLGSGPAVLVLPEMPGVTPAVLGFARRVADLGCTAVIPDLFGEVGRPPSPSYLAASFTRACASREFAALATGRTSPVAGWLRALARAEHARCGGPGVGVVGMCFTGGFALAAVVDAPVVAPVLSQPSLPIGLTRGQRRSLGLSADDLAAVRRRVADDDLCVMALRFTGDRMVPAERFARLREELGESFVAVEIDSSPGNPHDIPRMAHSVLTEHLVDEPGHPTRDALTQVLDLLRARLLPGT
ncbi:MAG TPA: dienelactone hydrolase family protein [Acidimicrobiales bacterium]|nr:dienelactone hydrolase family protein [Acidimicrobiales bacterium]